MIASRIKRRVTAPQLGHDGGHLTIVVGLPLAVAQTPTALQG
jgi:hypothetical protein